MGGIIDAVWTDTRQAARRILRAPGLSLVIVATLALALAANATIFSLLWPTVLRKLQAPRPDELIAVSGTDAKTGNYSPIHGAVLDALRPEVKSLSSFSAHASSAVRVEIGGTTVDTGVEGVEGRYFEVLEVVPRAGRMLSPADDPLSAVGVLSERMAVRLFGTAEAAVGQMVTADSRPIEIVGVAGGGFIGTRMDGGDDLFVPLRYLRGLTGGDTSPRAQHLIGRLAPGATLEDARAEIMGRWPGIKTSVAPSLPAPHQAVLNEQAITVDSFARGDSGMRDRFGQLLTKVMALAGGLLAIGCVNLSALMLARALTRQHEFAVRLAMGVSRARLFQQVALDGVLLSIAAVIVATPLAFWANGVLTSMVTVARLLDLGDTAPNLAVLAAATLVSLAAGILISLLPARRAMTLDMDDVLRGRGLSHRLRSARAIMITQVALSMVLVVGAGLFVTTLSNLYANDVHERDQPILFTRLSKRPLDRAKIVTEPYFQNLQDRLAAIPGVDATALSVNFPAYMGTFAGSPPTEPVTMSDGSQAQAMVDLVSPGFFDLYGITRLRGRDFARTDTDTSPPVAIITEGLARTLSATGDVVGRHVRMTSGGTPIDLEIVGLVADGAFFNIRTPNVPVVFRPIAQEARRAQFPMAGIRVTGSLAPAQQAYVDVVNAGGTYTVLGVFTVDGWIDFALVEQRLIAGTSSFAATLAMVLAAIGLFGMLAYSVSSRVREIGIRVSVGASHGDVLRMIVRDGMAIALPGVALGIPLALAAAWAVRSQLYGVSAADPFTIALASLVFIATAAIASWLPARRASRIQPIEALRQD